MSDTFRGHYCDKLGPLGPDNYLGFGHAFCLNDYGHKGDCRWAASESRETCAPTWMTNENLDAWNEECAVDEMDAFARDMWANQTKEDRRRWWAYYREGFKRIVR